MPAIIINGTEIHKIENAEWRKKMRNVLFFFANQLSNERNIHETKSHISHIKL